MTPAPAARLIVNADDCGYLPAVTRGIGAGIAAGAITATGVLANGPGFDAARALLAAAPQVDCGVHLNLTWGEPLTAPMARAFAASGGRFAGLGAALRRIAGGTLDVALVEAEWRAQIERVRDAGLAIRFLNSHQHIHLVPSLHALLRRLAQAYGVRHLRQLRPDWRASRTPGALVRSAVVAALGGATGAPPVPCVGLGPSGALDIADLERLVAALAPGSCTELMCHPGYADPAAGSALRGYHAWEQELAALCSARFREGCARHGVELARFRDLDAAAARSS